MPLPQSIRRKGAPPHTDHQKLLELENGLRGLRRTQRVCTLFSPMLVSLR